MQAFAFQRFYQRFQHSLDIANLLRIEGSQKASTDPLVCLHFLQTLLHQDLGTSLREKSLSSDKE